MKRLSLLVVVGAALWAGVAYADPEPTASSAAHEHFRRGLTHARNAELGLAAREFEAAYEQSPHFSVLYNLGQAYTALGRPVEAISAFERYLLEAGGSLDRSRHEQVQSLLKVNRERVGELVIEVASPTTRIWLNGKRLAATQLGAPLSLAAGQHTLVYSRGLGYPQSRTLIVVAGQQLKVDVFGAAEEVAELPGQLAIACTIPRVRIFLDGQLQGQSPLPAPLVVAPGLRRLRLQRAGYAPLEAAVDVKPGALSRFGCALRAMTPVPTESRAWLRLDVQPSDARVLVDGETFTNGALPAGPHSVVVRRAGYSEYERSIDLAPGSTLLLSARLLLSPAQLERRKQAAARRSNGVLLAGAGGILIATTVSLQIYNANKYDDWQASKAFASENENLRTATSIQRVDDLSIGLVIAGVGLLATGTWLALPFTSNQLD